MGLRETWNELGTGGKIVVGLVIGGVVLFVGILLLVVLAAVIGSFVLGMGSESVATAPQASFAFEHDTEAGETTIVHEGGDTIDADRLVVEIDEQRAQWDDPDGSVEAMDSFTVDTQPGDRIRLVYTGGETTEPLAVDDVPE